MNNLGYHNSVIVPKIPLFGPPQAEGVRGDFMNSFILKSPFIPLFQRGNIIFSCSFVSHWLMSIPVKTGIQLFLKVFRFSGFLLEFALVKAGNYTLIKPLNLGIIIK
jgi:hypothetical protein